MTLDFLLDKENINETEKSPSVDPKLQDAFDKVHELSREAYQGAMRRTYKAASSAERFLQHFESGRWGIRFTPSSNREFEEWRNNEAMWLILEMADIDVRIHNFDTFELQ